MFLRVMKISFPQLFKGKTVKAFVLKIRNKIRMLITIFTKHCSKSPCLTKNIELEISINCRKRYRIKRYCYNNENNGLLENKNHKPMEPKNIPKVELVDYIRK